MVEESSLFRIQRNNLRISSSWSVFVQLYSWETIIVAVPLFSFTRIVDQKRGFWLVNSARILVGHNYGQLLLMALQIFP